MNDFGDSCPCTDCADSREDDLRIIRQIHDSLLDMQGEDRFISCPGDRANSGHERAVMPLWPSSN